MSGLVAILAGAVCGVISGFGIGGGSLLMVWLTAVIGMEQIRAQSINLLYFLPTAAFALVFHLKNKQVEIKALFPAVLGGVLAAVAGALLAGFLQPDLLRKLFGGFLLVIGVSELTKKNSK